MTDMFDPARLDAAWAPSARHAAVVVAHAQDEHSGCGGTLQRLRQGGCIITRIALPPADLEYGEPLVAMLVDRLRACGADLVFAPSPLEPDAARRVGGMVCVEAMRRLGGDRYLALYEIAQPCRANCRVDISPYADAKGVQSDAALALARFRAQGLPGASLAEAFELCTAAQLEQGLPGLYASEHRRRSERGEAVDGRRDLPLVSVLVRSMQRDSLHEALDSIALQTWPNLEVVLINAKGGHHPEHGGHCGRFVLRLTNQDGPALDRPVAANRGLAEARGEWLMFLDDDDLIDPDHVARLRRALAGEPDARAAYAGVRLLGRDGRSAGMLDEAFDGTRLWLANFLPIHAVLFSRQAVDDGMRFDESLPVYEDWDFWRQFSLKFTMLHVPGATATYRMVGSSGLSARPDDHVAAEGRARFYRKWLPRFDSDELQRLATSAELNRAGVVEQAQRHRQLELQYAELNAAVAAKDGAMQALERHTKELHEQGRLQALDLGRVRQALEGELAAHKATREAGQRQADVQAAALAATLADLDAARAEVVATRADVEATRAELSAQLATTKAVYRQLEQGYRDVTGSLSWRVTAPMRALRSACSAESIRARWVPRLRALPLSPAAKQWLKMRLSATRAGLRVLRWLAPAAVPAAPVAASAASAGQAAPLDKEAIRADAEAALSTFLASGQRIVLGRADRPPQISVISVLYNQAGLSLCCMQGLAGTQGVDFEAIIVDNASTDRVPALLDRLDGATVLRPGENLGFVRAVNMAAAHARGEHVLLLNNDAVVEPQTLARAVARLEREPDVAAVGGPILLWDGRLQEAGSIVWRDGSTLGYGRGDAPGLPAYRFVRDVDYCSGAFLVVRRAVFEQFGRFDEAYAPAYYEETDLCARIWEAGLRVVYDPDVRVKHFEFASDVGSGRAIELQTRNRAHFVERNAAFIAQRPWPSVDAILRARQRLAPGCLRVLVIDDRVPLPWMGQGYPRAASLVAAIVGDGHFVTHYPLQFPQEDWADVWRALPERTEVMLDQGLGGLASFMAARAGLYDVLLVSRPHNMEVISALRRKQPEVFTGLRLVYDAEALFSLRDIAKAVVLGRTPSPAEQGRMIAAEMALAQEADAIVTVSEAEAQHYRRAGYGDVHVLGHAIEPQAGQTSFEARRGFLFVGAIPTDDCPNGDSLLWFVREVWPWIVQALGDRARLDIVGACEAAAVKALAGDSIRLHGRVVDVAPFYDQARVFVVPTRFAAGIPHKAHEAAAHGLPMVVTALIAEQLSWDEAVASADDARAFAMACLELHDDAAAWVRARQGQLTHLERDCSTRRFNQTVRSILRADDARHAAGSASPPVEGWQDASTPTRAPSLRAG